MQRRTFTLSLSAALALPFSHVTAAAAASKTKTVALPDGLKYVDIVRGKGAVPKPGQTVVVTYVGTFPDGKKFDASADHGGTFSFTIGQGQVIKGWDEGVITMHAGGRRKLIVPGALAYGEAGAGNGAIPPNATLLFDITLVSIS